MSVYPAGKLEWEDYKLVNLNQYVCIEKIKSMTQDDLEYLEEYFTTFLPDGKEYELEAGGSQKVLSVTNKYEYIEKTKEVHLAYLEKSFSQIRRGFYDYYCPYKFMLNSPSELDQLLCGMDYVGLFDRRWTSRFSSRSLITKDSMTVKSTLRSSISGTFWAECRKRSLHHTSSTSGVVAG